MALIIPSITNSALKPPTKIVTAHPLRASWRDIGLARLSDPVLPPGSP